MSNISMVEANLPPGFRFHPRDDELVCDYLMKKVVHGEPVMMIEVDLNKCEPWDIPRTACVGGKEWYFYSQRDRKYATGVRTNRATSSGYWKATGKDRSVHRKGALVGMRKTLVFYRGRAPKGRKTDWVMHEFRLEEAFPSPKLSSPKEDWVLCRVFQKSKEVSSSASVSNRTATGRESYDDTVPPLMDSYNIAFDQTDPQEQYLDQQEQVPCFSILSQAAQTDPILTTSPTIRNPNFNPTPPHPLPSGQPPISVLSPSGAFCEDQRVLKAVLSQLTKMDCDLKGSPSFREGSSDSYFSEMGMPGVWNY